MLRLGNITKLSPILMLSLAIIGMVRIITWAYSPSGNLQPDSATYLPTSWLNFDKVSFSGNSQRGWVTPLIYSLLPTNSSRILVQLCLGFVCWAVVLSISKEIFKGNKYQNLIYAFIVFLATSPNILQFETVLISTTYIIYSLLLFASYVIYVVHQEEYSFKSLMIIVLLGWIAFSLKSTNLIIILILAFYVLYRSREKLKFKTISLVLILGVLLMAHGSIVTINNNKFWANTYAGTAVLWHLGSQAPNAVDFSAFLKSKSVPNCVVKNAPFSNIDEEILAINSTCPKGNEYIRSQLRDDLLEYLVTNPMSAFNLISVGVAVAMTSSASHYGSSVSILPESIYGLFFGNVSPDFRILGGTNQSAVILKSNLSEPLWIAIPSLFFVLMGLYLSLIARKRRRINLTLLLVSTLSVIQIILTVLILPSEWFRQNSQYLLTLYLASAFSVALNFADLFKSSKKVSEL